MMNCKGFKRKRLWPLGGTIPEFVLKAMFPLRCARTRDRAAAIAHTHTSLSHPLTFIGLIQGGPKRIYLFQTDIFNKL
jgi:hypothetical protein